MPGGLLPRGVDFREPRFETAVKHLALACFGEPNKDIGEIVANKEGPGWLKFVLALQAKTLRDLVALAQTTARIEESMRALTRNATAASNMQSPSSIIAPTAADMRQVRARMRDAVPQNLKKANIYAIAASDDGTLLEFLRKFMTIPGGHEDAHVIAFKAILQKHTRKLFVDATAWAGYQAAFALLPTTVEDDGGAGGGKSDDDDDDDGNGGAGAVDDEAGRLLNRVHEHAVTEGGEDFSARMEAARDCVLEGFEENATRLLKVFLLFVHSNARGKGNRVGRKHPPHTHT